jgi:hypothetical protein
VYSISQTRYCDPNYETQTNSNSQIKVMVYLVVPKWLSRDLLVQLRGRERGNLCSFGLEGRTALIQKEKVDDLSSTGKYPGVLIKSIDKKSSYPLHCWFQDQHSNQRDAGLVLPNAAFQYAFWCSLYIGMITWESISNLNYYISNSNLIWALSIQLDIESNLNLN